MSEFDYWPITVRTEIRPGLWMGGLEGHEYLGAELADEHYAFASAFDVVLTVFPDAHPAPWGGDRAALRVSRRPG